VNDLIFDLLFKAYSHFSDRVKKIRVYKNCDFLKKIKKTDFLKFKSDVFDLNLIF